MNKLLKQLKSLKHDARFGGMNDDALASSWNRVAEAIGTQDVAEPVLVAVPSYGVWMMSEYISKPVMVGAFSVAVIASGWMTTVRAADSLPGEKLYSVKMITEKAQLKLASLDRRAVLHTEFAGRRLQEAVDLQVASTDDGSDSASLVHDAIEAYKQEVSSATESLRQLKDEGSIEALATASSVQQNLQAIDTTIDEVVADSASPEATQDALGAKEVTKVASEAATTVVVEVHEEDQSTLSANELKQMFRTELGQIEARQRFDLERITVIRSALADETVAYEAFVVPTEDDLLAFEYTIEAVDPLLSQAMNNFAAGGFRSAFERLHEIDGLLLDIEAQLAQIEVTITDARIQTPAASDVPVVEESDVIVEEEIVL